MTTMKAYDQGYLAFVQGKKREANPFDPMVQTSDWGAWIGGWIRAKLQSESAYVDQRAPAFPKMKRSTEYRLAAAEAKLELKRLKAEMGEMVIRHAAELKQAGTTHLMLGLFYGCTIGLTIGYIAHYLSTIL